ncbi:F0F1 ATP synthase subunit A [Caloramator sp. mosi_1]|nr:F0F1 ATP synthase subunit A [Caloramator sp. mosi_1]WDC84893.1 F0F1 ATP synthase subunit A [Caloramator sp. mosi_1]
MGKSEALFTLRLLGLHIPIYFSVLAQWIVMAFIMLTVPLVTRELKTVPKGKQIFVEVIVEKINSLVKGSMGDEYKGFAPFLEHL